MDSWFRLVATHGDIIAEVGSAFREMYGTPPGASTKHDPCVFYSTNSDKGRVTVTLYFSPAAVDLAKRFGAEECANPSKHGLSLLVGDPVCHALVRKDSMQSRAA